MGPGVGAYTGLRVLDFSIGDVGRITAMLLADHGADVVRITPDDESMERDFVWNRNKRRVRLDVATPEGLARARRLLSTADVALFDAPPARLEALGLSADALRGPCPQLLHVWLPAFGVRGRWSILPPSDLLLSAISGQLQAQAVNGTPMHLVLPQVTLGHALTAATAIAATLARRAETGAGEALVVTGLHGLSSLRAGSWTVVKGATPPLRSPRGLPHYHLYRCADGEWLFLGALRHTFFLRTLELMGLLDLLMLDGVDGDVTKLMQAPYGEPALDRMEEAFRSKSRAEWLAQLDDPLIPITSLHDREEWFASETVAVNEMRVELDDERRGHCVVPGVVTKLSRTPGAVRQLARDVDFEARLAPPREALAERAAPPARLPLADVVVLDLTTAIAGSFVGTALANFGAQVIKVEPPDGDFYRYSTAAGFMGWNWGKRGMVLDLKQPEGLELFYRLVKHADVVVDNFRPGIARRLGIDDERLREVNPDVVTASVTGYGPRGELATSPAFDTVLQAASGMMYTQGGREQPVNLNSSPVDVCTALSAAFGIATALYARAASGTAQAVSACLSDLAVFFQSRELSRCAAGEQDLDAGPSGHSIGVDAFQRLYSCRDGWVALDCPVEHRSVLLNEVRSSHVLPLDREETTTSGPVAQEIERWMAERTRSEVYDRLLPAHIGVMPVMSQAELYADPFFELHHIFVEDVHPDLGPVTVVSRFAEWDRVAGSFERPAPLLGQHTRDVLRELGLTDVEIDGLVQRDVVREARVPAAL